MAQPDHKIEQPAVFEDIQEEGSTRGAEVHNATGASLEGFARELAGRQQKISSPRASAYRAVDLARFANLREEEALIEKAVRYFRGAGDDILSLSYTAEWVLDNSYVVKQALRQIAEDLPKRYYQQLPKLDDGPMAGLPRVYALARELALFDKAHLDYERLCRFVQAYQTVTSLTMGEIWALPIMLRLVEAQIMTLSAGRVTGILDGSTPAYLRMVDYAHVLGNDEAVANSIMSLRMLSAQDWKEFFEDVSLVEQVLRQDPSGTYPDMDFITRDGYRKVIEAIARPAGLDEQEVASQAIRLAQEGAADKDHPVRGHVGYYLLADGQAELERRAGFKPRGSERLSRWIDDHATLAYLGGITLITALLVASALLYEFLAGGGAFQVVIILVLGILLSLTFSVDLVNWIVTSLVKPHVLPKMNYENGIPSEYATLVVMPVLLSGIDDLQDVLQQVEQHYLRNPDPNLRFALLVDLQDAPNQHMLDDEAIIERAIKGIKTLNDKYNPDQPIFYLFCRERTWNASEGIWMGWERKRGKLNQINQAVLTGNLSAFPVHLCDVTFLQNTDFIITLDADTILPRDSAASLVAAITHPLNKAVFDPVSGKVLSGYTILQPRIEVSPTSIGYSWFSRLFAGDTGLDLYTLAVSDVYQDLFREGIYTGKGIYDVAAFERSLYGIVPENALLSHDLFEGVHGRAGLVSDIALIEDYPPNYLIKMSRATRWVRGDWQLLPWLLTGRLGKSTRIKRNLSIISRWKLFDNLRRSLLPITQLAWFIAAWTILPGSAALWTLVGALGTSIPAFTGILLTIAPVTADLKRTPGVELSARHAVTEAGNGLLRWLIGLAFLPFEALLNGEAILVTLWRVYITHRHLLQWRTAAQMVAQLTEQDMEESDRQVSGPTWRQMIWVVGFSALLVMIVIIIHPQALLAAAPLILAWLVSPELAYRINRPLKVKSYELDENQITRLRRLARRTWVFFERFVGPEDHWLPPDHFQEDPLGVVAHRTSPTNIGLLLVSSLSAYDLGYIGLLDLAARLNATFENLDRLERFRGHFLNWYDTRNLEPLTPRYVSTVDSGNLAACLITLAEGCSSIDETRPLRWEVLAGMLDSTGLLSDLLENLEDADARQAASHLSESLQNFRQQVLDMRQSPEKWGALIEGFRDQSTAANDKSPQSSDQLSFLAQIDTLLMELVEQAGQRMGVDNLQRLRVYSRRLHQNSQSLTREIDLLLPWIPALEHPPALFSGAALPVQISQAWQSLKVELSALPELRQIDQLSRQARAQLTDIESMIAALPAGPEVTSALNWIHQLCQVLDSARFSVKALQVGFQELRRRALDYAEAMDFNFLFDTHRQVFHIGYNIAAGRLDNNYYDLLASEAQIASLYAIAKGDVPQSHWLHLARPITRVDHTRALLSWSATMFEYLMPSLFIREYDGTLIQQTNTAVVERQIEYGQEKGVPWGASESGYYRFDANQFYQYQAFGVPGLGYKRGLSEDTVIAPYASMLALPYNPQAVVKNLNSLERLGMKGTYGLYEAVDFTPRRMQLGQKFAIVRSYMAHHQGMTLLALANYLTGGLMLQRFHADPRIRSVNLLLQEKVPQDAPLEFPHAGDEIAMRPPTAHISATPWRVRVQTPQPRVHFLSNGRYGVMVTSGGGGYSTWRGTDLTRWRADTSLSDFGTWIYIQERQSGQLWSVGYQPTGINTEDRDIYFSAYMAQLRRRDFDISTSMEITVPPDDDLEVRRLTITNHSSQARSLRLSSYAEVILTEQATDARHPAFNKLFIESEYIPEINGLLFRRRPRSESEQPIYMAHILVEHDDKPVKLLYESDRARFIGRGHSARDPLVFQPGGLFSRTTGATLDPVMALGQDIELAPHSSIQMAYVTLAARSRQEAVSIAQRYLAWHMIERAFDQARQQAEVELRQLGVNASGLQRIVRLLSVLLFPSNSLRAAPSVLSANRKGQPGLWAYGISGDYPILLVKISDVEQAGIIHEVLVAHTWWRNRQIKIDLVFMNEEGASYGQDVNNHIYRLLRRMGADTWLNQRGGIFLVMGDQMPDEDKTLLETSARAILYGTKGSLTDQEGEMFRLAPRLPAFAPPMPGADDSEPTIQVERPADLSFDNGLGGFSPDGKEYIIYLNDGQWTPAPWVNIIAYPEFGFLASESGLGSTWWLNSGENRLTPWKNDPVSDPPAEAVYLRDEETGHFWSPTPLPVREDTPYLVRHGAGYTRYEHASHGLQQRMQVFAAPDAPVKIVRVRLENTWQRVRRITVTYYAEWVLGVTREASQQYIVPDFDGEHQALLAYNHYNEEFGERVAFSAANKRLHGLTADRTEFLGRMGNLSRPTSLTRIGLSGRVEAGIDPCAALQLHIDLQPGSSEEVYFLLGQAASRDEALNLVKRFQDPAQVQAAWESTGKFWDDLLSTVQVQTPDPAMNLLLNRWLLYEDLSCRLWGRTAFYQSSGAYGFRDQLQDVMALVYAAPQETRQQILRAAAHQFDAGDVLHWWHPPSGRGVRTRISDDLLWLPYVTAHYIETTGDMSILEEKVPFLTAKTLETGEVERYGLYPATKEAYSVYEHCRRAFEHGITHGPHGLPLIGTGDWNDGLNRVGIEGRGESIWLAWFLIAALERFAAICDRKYEAAQANLYRKEAAAYREAIEKSAWDGAWYLRAYYDDGALLGSSTNKECKIDTIAQSWAVLSGAGDEGHVRKAMQSAADMLVSRKDRLITLFTPPFDKTPRDPGYIKGYLPGVRENGGQYTHGAIWQAWATAALGQGDQAADLFDLLNPIYHSDTPQKVDRYKVEPYVIVADIYSVDPHTGRGGWTWYTGSAGWMYRLGLDAILGLRLEDGALRLKPCIPAGWKGYSIDVRRGAATYHIHVENPHGVSSGKGEIWVDGQRQENEKLPVFDSGEHDVKIVLDPKGLVFSPSDVK